MRVLKDASCQSSVCCASASLLNGSSCFVEPVARTSSIPVNEAPPPPTKKVVPPKVPETRPALETDDHKARNKDGLHSGQCLKVCIVSVS